MSRLFARGFEPDLPRRAQRGAPLRPLLVVFGLMGCSAGCDVTLAGGLQAAEAAQLTQELNRRGIAATQADDGAQPGRYRIDVTTSAVASVFAALRTQSGSWPKPEPAAEHEDAPLLPTKRDEQLRIARTLAADLARTIELMPGVLHARVHVTLPVAANGLAEWNSPPKAAAASAAIVLIREARTPNVVEQVRTLTAAAIPGVTASSVTVIEQLQPLASAGCAPLARLGPLTLAPASLSTLKRWLALTLLIQFALAGALLVLLNRQRRAHTS